MGSIESIPSDFVNKVSNRFKASRKLHIKFSDAGIFDLYTADEVIDKPDIFYRDFETPNYDFIVGDLPIGLKRVQLKDKSSGDSIKTRQNWAFLYYSLKNLTKDGLGLFVVEPAFWSTEWHQFLEFISRSEIFFIAAFRFPNQTLYNTSLHPNLAVFSRTKSDSLFVAVSGGVKMQ
jgi:hypothetical protein